MNLTKCSNGHFYDADRYSTCPHCNAADVGPTMTIPDDIVPETNGMDKTQPDPNIFKKKKDDSLVNMVNDISLSNHIDDDQKTIGIYSTGISDKLAPVVGWLVCVEGNHYGEDFRLVVGRNFVGRSSSMEVCLSGDTSISREKHLIIVFEPKQNTFIVQPGESKELSYLNDEVVIIPKVIKAGDILVMGNSRFVFVPFCTPDNNWSLYENEE